MAAIPRIGEKTTPGNPLTILSTNLAEMTSVLKDVRDHLTGRTLLGSIDELPHVPAIAYGTDTSGTGVWGVFCLSCTQSAGDYVFPCRHAAWDPMPPSQLIPQV